jgi:hypothetical protein
MSSTLIKVKNHTDLLRDLRSGAVINKNTNAYESAKRQKEYVLGMRQRLNDTEHELQTMKQHIKDLQAVVYGNK